MDWSLVLASQDIPHLIAPPEGSAGWTLQIATADVSRASQAIRQYAAENRARPWQQHYFEGRILFDWVALVWAAALIGIHALAESHPFIERAGVMHGADVARGQWWRLVTATQLHADWGHLASNLSLGFVLLGLVMGRWGTAVGMLAALLAGVGGNAVNLLRPEVFSLGASTVVMGCVGLLSLAPRSPASNPRKAWSGILGGIVGGAMLFILLGLDPRADVLSHAGGFVTGIGLAAALRLQPRLAHSQRANILATLVFAAMELTAWLEALRHSTTPR